MASLVSRSSSLPRRALLGFLAGALAVLTFHQATILALTTLNLIQGSVYAMRPLPPFGVPTIASQAFWGGLWGIAWALVADRLPRRWSPWLAGLVLGAVFPTLVAWFVAAPLKGQAVAAGWNPARMWVGPVVGAAFGLGTAVFYGLLRRSGGARGR